MTSLRQKLLDGGIKGKVFTDAYWSMGGEYKVINLIMKERTNPTLIMRYLTGSQKGKRVQDSLYSHWYDKEVEETK